MQPRVVLVKVGYITVSDSHFAGGKHAFSCIACALARRGVDVHLVFVSTKPQVLLHAVSRNVLAFLQQQGDTVIWKHEGVTHHAVVAQSSDADVGAPRTAATWDALLGCVDKLTNGGQCPILVDADDSQASSSGLDTCLFAELARHFHLCMSVLVQNVHFLPFGPSGSSPRHPALLDSWRAVQRIYCVSQFVAEYLQQHSTSPLPPLQVVPLAAFGVYGDGPFPDFGERAAEAMEAATKQPVVGMLKLTPEKGSAVLFELCKSLPSCSFLAVAADPHAWQEAAMRELSNLQLTEPKTDVNEVLQHMSLLLAPSLWLEAWGMVVVEAMLRGIPVVASDAGGLPEACLEAALVVPVNKIVIPVNEGTGCPDWQRRSYPSQDVQPWVEAVQQLLGDTGMYLGASHRCREAAKRHLEEGPQHFSHFMTSLLGGH